jgi:hypothetical protein
MWKMLVGAALFSLALPVHACAEIEFGPAVAFHRAYAVVAATAQSAFVTPAEENPSETVLAFPRQHVLWEVGESWKGPFKKGELVSISSRLGPCAVAIREHESALLFLIQQPDGGLEYSFIEPLADKLLLVPVLYRLAANGPGA